MVALTRRVALRPMPLVLRAQAVLLKFIVQAGLLDDANRQWGAYRVDANDRDFGIGRVPTVP